MDKFEAAAFTVISEPVLDPAEVVSRVAAQRGDGWVCYASGNVATRSGEVFTTGDGARGLPLSGEWAVDGNTSVHLRQLGEGWVWSRFEETPGADRVVAMKLLGTARFSTGVPNLCYRALWRRQAAGIGEGEVKPWTRLHARFAGWGD